MKFITGKTKITGVVISALTIVALITMIMLSTLIDFIPKTRIVVCLIYSLTLMLLILILKGLVDLFVFRDYKCQSKSICTEGVLNICMGVLLAVTGILFAVLQGNNIVNSIALQTLDIRYFLASFTFAMSMWKLSEMLLAIRHKHFDRLIDILSFSLWVMISLFILISIFVPSSALSGFAWTIIALSWSIIVINVVNIVYSYVIKAPDYLITGEALDLKISEVQEIELKKANEQRELKGKNLKANLQQLKQLYESNLITQADYNARKKQLLENTFGRDYNE